MFSSSLLLTLQLFVIKDTNIALLHTPQEHLVSYFKRSGFKTIGVQRLFHKNSGVEQNFDENIFLQGEGPYEPRKGDDRLADPRLDAEFDFGTIDAPVEENPDWKAINIMLNNLEENVGTPSFFAVGLKQCHNPIYVSAETMEAVPDFPLFPPIPEDDFDDIPGPGKGFGAAFRNNA